MKKIYPRREKEAFRGCGENYCLIYVLPKEKPAKNINSAKEKVLLAYFSENTKKVQLSITMVLLLCIKI